MLMVITITFSTLTAQIRFRDVTKKAGLEEPLKGIMGHSAAWGDVNGDQLPDLFVGTFTHLPDSIYNKRGHSGGKEPNKLFLNQGDGTFSEVADGPMRVKGRNSGVAFADFDNDGDLDMVLSHRAKDGEMGGTPRNYLFENDGRGNFSDITEASGIDFGYPFMGRSTFVFDYDGDGLLDLFMQEDYVQGFKPGGYSRLMKNTGGMVFRDVTTEAGFPTGLRTGLYGLGGFVGDVNGDGWADVFFAHLCKMYINNQDGTFHETGQEFVDKKYTLPGTVNQNWTCGADMGDLDGDGDMDFVMGDHFDYDSAFHRLYIFLNEGNDAYGDPFFRDISLQALNGNPDGRAIHIQIQDIDNDGKRDILTSRCNSLVYKNIGVSNGIPIFGDPVDSGLKGGIGYWAGGSFADFDRDGRLDFFGPEWEAGYPSPLLRNTTRGAKHYLDIRLDLENSPNRNGIGAKVELFKAGELGKAEGRLDSYIISVTNGYSSAYEARSHTGLPHDKKVDIRVSMPCGGLVIIKEGIDRDQTLTIR